MVRVSLHAAVDESYRRDQYLLTAALITPGELRRLRALMRSLLLPGQRELHFQKEKPQRRRQLFDQVLAGAPNVVIYTATCSNRDQETARAACLHQLVVDLAKSGGQRLILDTRHERNHLDNATIRTALRTIPTNDRLSWEHLDSAADPLIWIPDMIGWAWGAGGDWRTRTASVVTAVIDCNRT
jgi:hypothetical protein